MSTTQREPGKPWSRPWNMPMGDSDVTVTTSGPWFNRSGWPRYRELPFPHDTVSESGLRMIVDRAGPEDESCEATTKMRHGLDEVLEAVCIMPRGHDTPHMPQSPRIVAETGRLIVRSLASGEKG